MNSTNHHKPVGLEWLRLVTPFLLFIITFMVNNIWNELQKVSKEQARRTVIVQDAYKHMNDPNKHVNNTELEKKLDRIDYRLQRIEEKIK